LLVGLQPPEALGGFHEYQRQSNARPSWHPAIVRRCGRRARMHQSLFRSRLRRVRSSAAAGNPIVRLVLVTRTAKWAPRHDLADGRSCQLRQEGRRADWLLRPRMAVDRPLKGKSRLCGYRCRAYGCFRAQSRQSGKLRAQPLLTPSGHSSVTVAHQILRSGLVNVAGPHSA
jgi:hypothetical protein